MKNRRKGVGTSHRRDEVTGSQVTPEAIAAFLSILLDVDID